MNRKKYFALFLFLLLLPPSKTARKASTRNGELFPTNSYITLPNGAPTGSVSDSVRTGVFQTFKLPHTECKL